MAVASAAVDVVGVFTPDYKQVFAGARPIKATVKPDSKSMEHPLENGTSVIDQHILTPVEIELSLILLPAEYADVYQQIAQLFKSSTLLTVQTRASVYLNQLITAMPHDEDPDMINVIPLALKLRETQFAGSNIGEIVPLNPANSDTTQRGGIQNNEATPSQTERSSLLYRLIN